MKNKYGQDIYRKVYYLRPSVDGSMIEGRFGGDFYIVSNLPEDISVLDMTNPEYCGIKLEVKKEYFVLRSDHYNTAPLIQIAKCDFMEVATNRNDNLIVKFEENEGRNRGYVYEFNMTSPSTVRRVFEIEEFRELPQVFRVGRKLKYCRYGDSPATAYCSHLGIALPYNHSLRDAPLSLFVDKLVEEDKFVLPSWDLDLEFSIGDKVVVANWNNPVDMLTVKQIQGFVTNKDTGDITFTMIDKNGKLYDHLYVDGRHRAVKIGSVRKITNRFGDLSAGMKITANTTGISMFPKKDTNIIIGFLIDSGGPQPLVLCSNACTLWYNDVIESFDIIPMSDPAWKTKQHAPINPSKIRIQSGDFLQGNTRYSNNFGYFAYRPRESRTIRAQHLGYYDSYEEGYIFDKYFTRDIIFDSFLNPRLTAKQEEDLTFVNAFPNFHGMYTQTDLYYSPYLFPNDPRSILNVPNHSV